MLRYVSSDKQRERARDIPERVSCTDTVAREHAGDFGSIGIPATGEEGKIPPREEEKGKKCSKVNCVLLLSSSILIHSTLTQRHTCDTDTKDYAK
jgi:hypothetical protein